jgi:Zn-dependent alcohol dehydrogenase
MQILPVEVHDARVNRRVPKEYRMRAAVCRGVGQIGVEELDDPHPLEGEVRLRMVATGVCGTDLSIYRGHLPIPFPVVLGHEGAGVVEEVGPGVRGLALGDHVVCTIIAGCGLCRACVRGEPTLCEQIVFYTGKMLDDTTRLCRGHEAIHSLSYQASFAEQAIVPEACAVKVREDAPLEKVAGLACGVSTGLGAAMVRAPVAPGSSVVVIGTGGVGLSVLMGARLRGATQLIAVDVAAHKLEKARELGLATDLIDASKTNVVEAVQELTGGAGADYAYDAVGKGGSLETAIQASRAGGTVVAIGVGAAGSKIELDPSLLMRQRWLTGTFGGSLMPRHHIPEFVDLYMAGRLDLDGLMDAQYSLDQVGKALGDLEESRITRGVIRF